jgi:hypothetical protein
MRALPLIERVLLVGATLLIVVLLAFLLVWHLRWNAMQRRIAAIVPRPGVVMTVPGSTDPALLAEYRAWRTQAEIARGGWRSWDPDTWAWQYGAAGPPPANALVIRTATAGLLGQLHTLLARGLHLAGGARVRDQHYDQAISDDDREKCRDFSTLQDAANWWSVAAAIDGRPDQAVENLDAMIAAVTPVDSGQALAMVEYLASYRDDICLRAAVRGQWSADLRQRWRSASDGGVDQLIPALEGERRTWFPREAARRFAMDPLAYWHLTYPASPWSTWRLAVQDWWALPDQLDADLMRLAAIEDSAAGRVGSPTDWAYGMNLDGVDDSSLRCGFAHRQAVLADEVLEIRARTGALPESPALDLAGGPERLPLRYRRLDPDRFEIVVDQQAACPEWLRIYQDSAWSLQDPGKPGKLPAIYCSGTDLVIDCAGRTAGSTPVPAPPRGRQPPD